jgi:hypothetical protein
MRHQNLAAYSLLMLMISIGTAQDPQDPLASIEGRVEDAATGAPFQTLA